MKDSVQALLDLFLNAGVSYYITDDSFAEPERFDMGMRLLLMPDAEDRYEPLLSLIRDLAGSCMYHLQDAFYAHYVIFRLPDADAGWLSVGPVLIDCPDSEAVLSITRRLGLPASAFQELENFYSRLVCFRTAEAFDAICFALGDVIFSGRDNYSVETVRAFSEQDQLQRLTAAGNVRREENPEEKYKKVEKRYELENVFLRTVKTGDAKAAVSAYNNFIRFISEDEISRMPDRLRDDKDLGISMNSHLRKAAEETGVHPYYIDAFSNASIGRLEQCSSTIEVHSFYRDLIRGYCELINEYGLNRYSRPVQDAIIIIQTDLAQDLSLAAIAARLDLSHSYLSALFRRETGVSLSEYVLDRRIRRSKHLLSATPLPVQDIAWEVGIPDANYFARLFKRETGMTAREYRESCRL